MVHVDEVLLETVVRGLRARPLEAMDLRCALQEVVETMPTLFSADGAGILLVDEAQVLRHVCSTDRGAQLLESVQEASGRGPCVESLLENSTVAVCDISTDERWPELAPLLAPSGVRAVIGVPVRLGGVPVGSLNAFCRAPREWDGNDRRALDTIEGLIERILTSALLADRQEVLIGQLQRALDVRVHVERAVGVVMAVGGLDAAEAFECLRQAARSSRRPVRDVAGDVLATRRLP